MKTSPEIGSLFSPERIKVRRQVWGIAVPVMLANLTIPLVGLVDTAVMGHFDQSYYIGAVAMGSFMFSLMTIAFGFQRMAVTGLIAQARGAGDHALIYATLYRAVMVAIGLGFSIVLLALPVLWIAPQVLSASEDVLDGMAQYISIIAFAGPGICLNMVGLGFLFGVQHIRGCMAQMIIINLVNVAANLVLVFGFEMKIEGVALASVLAQYIGVGVTFLLVRSACRSYGKPPKWSLALLSDARALTRYASLGRDLTIRTAAILVSEIIVLNAAGGMSDDALAATQVGFVFFGVIAYGLDGFAHAVEALVGNAIGAKSLVDFRRAVAESSILGGVAAVVVALMLWLGGGVLMRVITSIPSVLAMADGIMIWIILMPVISIWAFLMDGVFIGATRAKMMRNAMLVSMVFFLPLVYLGRLWGGLDGIWLAFNILLGLRGVTLWLKLPEVEKNTQP
jgi:MATE family multidrug resistance protein